MIAELVQYADRCEHGYHLTAQHPALCSCQGQARKAEGITRAEDAADPDLRAIVDEEIRRAAAAGETFSANTIRHLLPDDVGPLMGARFLAAAKAGVIRHVGYEQSTKPNTHAHDVKTWRAA